MKILIVDDNQELLDVMKDLLSGNGHEVILAEDGKRAREVLETEKVDLVVSDVFMPTLDGNRFHSYVRECLGETDLPFIFYSGYDSEKTKQIVGNSKVDYFLSKSSPIDTIVNLIDEIGKSAKPREKAKVDQSAQR